MTGERARTESSPAPSPTTERRGRSTRSRVLVLALIALGLVGGLFARWYVSSGSDVGMLASIDCATLHPTIGELQGRRITIASDHVCATLHDLASATPVSDRFVDDVNDPWHTIGRVRVLPGDDAWFLVFVARASTGFRPELSLRHRRGAGWAIVGHYDGAPALERLGLLEQIDSALLASPASLGVRDERVAM